MGKDYYKTLGVEQSASKEEIKKAFRKKAHEHHPDKPNGNAERFKEAAEAYGVLSDDEKRQQYDQFGTTFDQAGAQGFPGGFGGFSAYGGSASGRQGINFDFSDFPDLSDVLGQMFGVGGRRGARGQARGRDIEKDLPLSFKEAIFGAEKTIELYSHIRCERCKGNGAEPGTKLTTCAICNGSGQTQITQRTFFGQFVTRAVCDGCGGTGQKPEKACKKCHSAGISRELRKLKVKIPAGAEDGGVLHLSGQGETAPHSGIAGDLFLRVRVKPDKRFERHGQDVFSRANISFTTAAMGGKVEVETVDGQVELKIPTGTQPGSLFRLRGKGVPYTRRAGRGDHIVEVTVDVPTKLSRKQKKLLEEFGE